MPEFRGVVFDDVGVAVQNATVNLYDADSTSPSRANAVTDSSGLWHIGETGTGSDGAASVDFDTRRNYDVKIANGTDVVWLRSRDRYQVSMMQAWQADGATVPAAVFTNADAGASSLVAIFEGDSASPADNDEAYNSYKLSDDGGNQEEVARVTWHQYDVNPTADGGFEIEVASAGTLYKVFDAVTATGGAQTISIGTGLSGTTINIGHGTSDVNVKDSLTVETDLTLATGATVTGIDNGSLGSSATLLATQGAIKTYVDAQQDTVDTLAEILALSNTTGGTDIIMTDGDDLNFGSGGDIMLRHSGAVSANAEVTTIIAGTSVHPGVAADSLIVSNITASGDIMFATNRGGNTEAHMLFDASAGDTFLYARGVEALKIAGGGAMTITPALTVTGAITASSNVTVTGNLTVNGTTTTVDTATLSVEDPLIALATGNAGADTFDIGFYGLYDTSGSQDLYAGLFRDADDSGKWKLFKDNQAAPGATAVNTSGTGYAVGTLVANLEGNVTGNASGSAATVTGGTQASITSTANLVTVGTIGTGVWQGTAVAADYMAQGTTSAKGALEIATTAEINTSTDADRAMTPDLYAASNYGIRYVQIMAVAKATALTVTDGLAYFHVPAGMDGMDLVEVHAEVFTAPVGSTATFEISLNGASTQMLSTNITIDAGETGSDSAATAAVINASTDDVDTNDLIQINCTQVGSSTAGSGLLVTMGFRIP